MKRTTGKLSWLRLGAAFLGLYLAVVAGAWWLADGLIFQPQFASGQEPPGAVRIKVGDAEVSALFLPNPGARLTLWYFHGNAEDLGDVAHRLRALRELGFSVFACEYPGYGINRQRPSEAAIYEANAAALAWLERSHGITADRLLLYGRSVGAGPAVELATRAPVAGLVLESAFTSAYRVMTRWRLLPFDRFTNLAKMPRVKCPVLLIHGRRDEIVGFHHAEALFAAAPGQGQKLWVENAGHNDVGFVAGDALMRSLREFADGL